MSEGVAMYLRSFRLPTTAQLVEEAIAKAEAEDWGYRRLLTFLCESEHQDRQQRRIQRFLAESNLPPDKTLANLDQKRFPVAVRRELAARGEYAQLWGQCWFAFPNPVYGDSITGTIGEVFAEDRRWTPGTPRSNAPAIMNEGQ